MKLKIFSQLFLASITAFLFCGCAPNISPNSYNVQNVGSVQNVISGVIVEARPVQVNRNTGIGGIAGAVAGGAAGSAIGGGARANIIGGVGGALAGGLLGSAIEGGVSRQTGIEYIVRTNKGNMLSVVQGPQMPLAVGQRVLVIMGNPARIIPNTQ